MWIKICGTTSQEDAEMAIAAGADALGFVFAESPRRIDPQNAREIISRLPESVEKIGVFVDAMLDEALALCQFAGLTGAQLHRSSRERPPWVPDPATGTPHRFRLINVVRHDGNRDRFAGELRAMRELPATGNGPRTVLVDSCVRGQQGGTGHAFDWAAASIGFLEASPHLQLIAAGGLRPQNVAEAIQTLQPWGVDVSSGVEASPGKKDPAKMAAFIRKARQAGK